MQLLFLKGHPQFHERWDQIHQCSKHSVAELGTTVQKQVMVLGSIILQPLLFLHGHMTPPLTFSKKTVFVCVCVC